MKKRTKIILTVLIVLTVLFGFLLWQSNFCLTVNNYKLKTDKIDGSVHFVLISDLHNREFGKDNSTLADRIAKEDPDFIAIDGDMVTSNSDNREPLMKLLKHLKGVAPIYYVMGNHERAYSDYEGLVKDIKSLGVKILDNEMVKLDIGKGKSITIGGLTDFPYYEFEGPDFDNERSRFLDSFIEQEKDNYSILLAHSPEFYYWGLYEKKIDLMLCGHTHGGVIDIPFVGGLYAPNQGWLPTYYKGFYTSGTTDMIITAGLGNNRSVPRFNNPPEICVIDIN